MKEQMCTCCGLTLRLTGDREPADGGEREYMACTNPGCRLNGKRQGYRFDAVANRKVVQHSEEVNRARAAYVARRLAQRKV